MDLNKLVSIPMETSVKIMIDMSLKFTKEENNNMSNPSNLWRNWRSPSIILCLYFIKAILLNKD